MLFYYKAISNTEINWTEKKKKERGSWNAIISDIKDIKREDIESGLKRNYIDFYKIFKSTYSCLNIFKGKKFQSIYLDR